MGLNFRKRIKLAPGVHLNIGKKGISSVSVGRRGASMSIGKKGARTNLGIPGTGLSYSKFYPSTKKNSYQNTQDQRVQQFYNNEHELNETRNISMLLSVGILIMPYIFSWLTLRKGYSNTVRFVSFLWMIFVLIAFT